MPHLRTFTCTPGEEVTREAITFTGGVQFDNPGLLHVFNRGQRPAYKFDLTLGPLTRGEAESLSAFHAFHQAGKSFLWNGDIYGSVANPNLVGEGDDSRRDFFLPVRYVGAGSLTIYTRNQATGVTSTWVAASANAWPYSLNPNPGLVTFANSANTIPASGHDFYAAWGNQYRCLFSPEGLTVTHFARGLYRVELSLFETLFTD